MSTAKPARLGLFCELFWGDKRNETFSFGVEVPRVEAAAEEGAQLPLYTLPLPPGRRFLLAEQVPGGHRIRIPPGCTLERRRGAREPFVRAEPDGVDPDGVAWARLGADEQLRLVAGEHAVRFSASLGREKRAALTSRDFAGLAIAAALFLSLPIGFLLAGPTPERQKDFTERSLRLAREKEEERRRALGADDPLRPLDADDPLLDGGARVRVPGKVTTTP